MRLSESFFYTLREDAKDEESASGNLLVKSGMFKKIGNGIYMKMPYSQKLEFTLGLRLVRSTEQRSFPLRVLRMAYEERSIYENSNVRKD